MIIHAVHVGQAQVHIYQGRQVSTGFFKRPADHPVTLSRLGVEGDQQADLVHHGGPDKAVLVYPLAHYGHWTKFLGRDPGPAALGENLTVDGLTEETVCIGDQYQVGSAVLQVCQPRIPCFKINLRHGVESMQAEVVRTGFSGFYLRVLQEGKVAAGDSFTLIHRPDGAPTVAFANRIMHHEKENLEAAQSLVEAEGMADVFRNYMQKRLSQG